MIILLGFLAMVALLLASMFDTGEASGYDSTTYAICPTCGMRGVRIAQVWDMYPDEPTWCRKCGTRYQYKNGVLQPL
jgi:hypothetical protein